MTPCIAATRCARALSPLAISILLVATGAGAQSEVPPTRSAAGQACTVREISRAPLTTETSREMYIEPTAVLPSGGEIFLGGSPNYLFAPGGPDDDRDFVRDSIFGAIVGPNGRARLVPAPIDPTRIIDIRGLVLEQGGWALAFAELKHPWRPPAPDTVIRYWYGVFDGRSWVRLEALPIPPAGELLTAGASALLIRGDTTFLAVRVQESRAGIRIALYKRQRETWNITMLERNGAAYATLMYQDSMGLVLGVARADRNAREVKFPGELAWDTNSFFLHTGPEWRAARKILSGNPAPVHGPVLAFSRNGPILSWVAVSPNGRQARAMIGSLAPDGRVIVIDSATNHVVLVERLRESPLWISEHVGSPAGVQLRFVGRGAGDAPVLLARMPNPYTGPFGAAATSADELVVSGPLLRRDAPHPSLVSLLIRARVECAVSAPRPDGSTLARRVYVHPPVGGLDAFFPSPHRARDLRAFTARLREREEPDVSRP